VTEPAYLLDSNICIYLLQGKAPLARGRIENCRPGEIVTSAVAFAEVIRGARGEGPDRIEAIASLFRVIPILPFDERAARLYASIPFKRGTFDRLIAAHALALDATFVTSNLRDFRNVPGLKLEDWTVE
jgi:tRNA(fMet)-specific endonuclease VapC